MNRVRSLLSMRGMLLDTVGLSINKNARTRTSSTRENKTDFCLCCNLVVINNNKKKIEWYKSFGLQRPQRLDANQGEPQFLFLKEGLPAGRFSDRTEFNLGTTFTIIEIRKSYPSPRKALILEYTTDIIDT